jgi:UDP-2,3-diacylglucosamine hydrolase
MRFDVPVIGLATIQAMRIAGANALSIDAGKALMFEKDALLASANEAGITIVGRGRN